MLAKRKQEEVDRAYKEGYDGYDRGEYDNPYSGGDEVLFQAWEAGYYLSAQAGDAAASDADEKGSRGD